MLERYEQKILLEYLIEGLSKLHTCKGTTELRQKLEDLIENINDYQEDCSINFGLNVDIKKYDCNATETLKNHLRCIEKQLKNEHKKVKNAKISNREKCFKTIQKIFNLTDEETSILGLMSRNETSEAFCSCLCLASDRFKRVDAAKMCKCYLKHSSTINESISHLRDLGLFTNDGRRGLNIGIPDFLSKIMENSNHISTKNIVKKIMGTELKTNLKKKDFEHIKDEFNLLQLILSNAIKQEKKGINILLYGEVGTGKTEFAKVIAKYLKLPLYEITCEDDDDGEANRYERLEDLKRKIGISANIKENCMFLFDEAEDIFKDTFFNRKTESKAFINKMLENNSTPIIWTTNDIHNMDKAYLRRFTYSIKFEELSDDVQLKFLKKRIQKE